MTRTNWTPAQIAIRRHNSMVGLAVCIQKNAQTISATDTATAKAKILADTIWGAAKELEQALRAGRKS